MSWSFSAMGKPEKVAAAIEEYSSTLSGESKVEYDEVAPHLAALVRQNQVKTGDLVVVVNASGHGTVDTQTREILNRQVSVKLEYSHSKLLV